MLRKISMTLILVLLSAAAAAAAEAPCQLHCESPACQAGEIRLSCQGTSGSEFHLSCRGEPVLLAFTTGGQRHLEDGIDVAYSFDRRRPVETSFVWTGLLATTTTPADIRLFRAGLATAERLDLRVGERHGSFDLRALATSDRHRIAQACGASASKD